MITVFHSHPCQACRIELDSWDFKNKLKVNAYMRSHFPVDESNGETVSYKCKACGHSGRGTLWIDEHGTLLDVKETLYG